MIDALMNENERGTKCLKLNSLKRNVKFRQNGLKILNSINDGGLHSPPT